MDQLRDVFFSEGMGIGIVLGVAIGAAMDNIPMGLGLGIALGAGLGEESRRRGARARDDRDEGDR